MPSALSLLALRTHCIEGQEHMELEDGDPVFIHN